MAEERRQIIVRVDRQHFGHELVGTHHHDAALGAADAAHVEDVAPVLEIGAEDLLVIAQAVAAFARQQVRGQLARFGLDVDRIATSPLPRARRTAEILAEALGLEDRLEDAPILSAGSSARAIAEWLAEQPEASLMIVGETMADRTLLGVAAAIERVLAKARN